MHENEIQAEANKIRMWALEQECPACQYKSGVLKSVSGSLECAIECRCGLIFKVQYMEESNAGN